MINSPLDHLIPPGSEQQQVEAIVRSGPSGALALAGTATAIVMAIWFIFYFAVFLPRGFIH